MTCGEEYAANLRRARVTLDRVMAETTITDPDVYRPDAPVDERGRVSAPEEYLEEIVSPNASLGDTDA